jgi:hypothetical protein
LSRFSSAAAPTAATAPQIASSFLLPAISVVS